MAGSKLASHGNWMEWSVDTNGGTSGESTTQVRHVNLASEIDTFADTDFATTDTTQLRGRTMQSFDERSQRCIKWVGSSF